MMLSINFSGKTAPVLLAGLILFSGCVRVNEPVVRLVVEKPAVTNERPLHLVIKIPTGTTEGPYTAVLPVSNLSGTKAPVRDIREAIIRMAKHRGLRVVGDRELEDFMAGRRLRYTGAINGETARAFKKELNADAVLITSLELYDESYPPKLAMTSRLVSTGARPEILWLDGVGLAGDDMPGILGLGLVEKPSALLDKGIRALSESLGKYISGKSGKKTMPEQRKEMQIIMLDPTHIYESSPLQKVKFESVEYPAREASKFQPKMFYRSPVLSPLVKYRIAIMPFINKTERKNAGDILVLHFIKQLRGIENFDVIEPGIVRDDLLRFRIIMNEGISYEDAGLVFSTLEAEADLILSGTVIDYQDYLGPVGTPKVDFSVLIIERKSREVVWTSKSYNTGNEGVFFFDYGQINTAHSITSEMTRLVSEMILAN